jgi:hypothetical protein
VRGLGKNWRVEVMGIHAADSHYWLQLRLVGHPTTELIVRVLPRTSTDVALRMVADAVIHEHGQSRMMRVNEAA